MDANNPRHAALLKLVELLDEEEVEAMRPKAAPPAEEEMPPEAMEAEAEGMAMPEGEDEESLKKKLAALLG